MWNSLICDSDSEPGPLRQDSTFIPDQIFRSLIGEIQSGKSFCSVVRFFCRDTRWMRADL